MPLRIKCPTGHTLIVPDDRAGRTLRCPRCSQSFSVPGGGEAAELAKPRPVVAEAAGGGSVATVKKQAIAKTPSSGKAAVQAKPVVKPKSRALPLQEMPAEKSVRREVSDPEVRRRSRDPAVADMPSAEGAGSEDPRTTSIAAPVSEQIAAPPVIAAYAPATIEPPLVLKTLEPSVETEPAPSVAPPAAQPEVNPPQEIEAVAAEALVEPPMPEALAEAGEAPAERETDTTVSAPAAQQEVPPAGPHEPVPPPVGEEQAQPVTITLAADRSKVLVVYQLAASLVAAALFSMVPAVWDVVEYIQFYDLVDDPRVARWALVLFFLGIVQLAYAVYLFQLPDWTSVWVVTMYSLLMAAIYAATLGLVLISREDGGLVGGLQLADKLTGGKAALWCLCMVSVSTMLAFFAGRLSVRWHKAEMLLRSAGV